MAQDSQAEDERIRGYLVSLAKRSDIPALWPRVIADRTALLLALDRVTEEQARWRSDSTAWTILEVAQHMLVWSRSVTNLVEALSVGDTAEVPDLGAFETDIATLAGARDALTREAIRFAALPTRLSQDPDLAAEAHHPRFGPLDHRAWFLFARLHDGDHTRQIEAIKAADGYPSAGLGSDR